jgi:hypothetical protein
LALGQHLSSDRLVNSREVVGLFVYVIEATEFERMGKATDGWMARGAEREAIGRGKEMPGLTCDQAGISRS